MLKFAIHSSESDADLAQQQVQLDQMLELLATTKLLRQFCIELHALYDQVPAPQVQYLLEQTQAHYTHAMKHLMLMGTVLIEPVSS